MEIIKDDRLLNEQFIRELHKMILKESYEVDAVTPGGESTKKKVKIGEYKSSPNYVKTSTGEILQFASPEETPAKMQDLIDWYKSLAQDRKQNPIFLATQFHYRFIRIHP
ncbi:MAG: Fic family protein, partial [Bacteroidota bacterium]